MEAALTLALALLGQTASREAAQDLEGTLAKERPHIKTQGTDLPPGTLWEISTAVAEADLSAILDKSLKVKAALKILDKAQASVLGCLTWVLEAM